MLLASLELNSLIIPGTVLILVWIFFYIRVFLDSKGGTKLSGQGKAAASNGVRGENSVLILFGSQSGTAEAFSKSLGRECAKRGIHGIVCDAEEYNPEDLALEKVVLVICATYADGEPTGNMKAFHDWIMDDARLVGAELATVKYAVFGLGDRQYKFFCREGLTLDARFAELGAERFYGMGIGDADSGNLEGQFEEWVQGLWGALSRALGARLEVHPEEIPESECRVKFWEDAVEGAPYPATMSILEPTQRLPVAIPVVRNEELIRGASTRSTRLLEFDLTNTIISYQAGDYLGILACNLDTLVEAYLARLGLPPGEAERVLSLQDKKTLKNVFPARVSVRTALKWYLDLAGPPKKSTLRTFASYCTDAQEKTELLRLLAVDAAAQKEYDRLLHELRTVLGFLNRFRSMKITLPIFLEYMPRIAPRYFSISSDLLYTPSKVSITVGVVEGGLCTPMLQRLKVNDCAYAFVLKSSFHLPLRAKERPIIMIGPGTGVAPFIGFIQRRYAWKEKGATLGEAMLFFGCRHSAEDHIYEDFTRQALNDGILSAIEVAYSRDQPEKIYVQHRLKQRGKDVWRIIHNDNGNLYICGDAKHMVHDVEAELLQIAQREGGLSKEEASEFLTKMGDEDRYLKDVW
ncbi:unnamed protein product [Phytomonas sp. EM1]|nr:unnamed protein product [Phytomonas sp. EM1]|eukprot:CCW62356.1 unnamed protein product [Phytomonas sp. isolate EM1]